MVSALFIQRAARRTADDFDCRRPHYCDAENT